MIISGCAWNWKTSNDKKANKWTNMEKKVDKDCGIMYTEDGRGWNSKDGADMDTRREEENGTTQRNVKRLREKR